MEFLLSPPTLSRRPGVQQPGVGLRETSWKPRPAASGLQCCGRALGHVRSPPAVLQEGSHVQGPGLPLLYTHPPTEAPPGPFRIQS